MSEVSWEHVARNLAYKLGAAHLELAISEETAKVLQGDNVTLQLALAQKDPSADDSQRITEATSSPPGTTTEPD